MCKELAIFQKEIKSFYTSKSTYFLSSGLLKMLFMNFTRSEDVGGEGGRCKTSSKKHVKNLHSIHRYVESSHVIS